MKNATCVNGTIEITLEQIQCDFAMSKSLQIHIMCVKTLSALTHITQIRGDFDIVKLCWIHSNVISMVPFTHAAFFYRTKIA